MGPLSVVGPRVVERVGLTPALRGDEHVFDSVMFPPPRTTVADQLIIRGAREHNLKDVSLDLPRDSLIVFTGLSGSGKSSLAFDTIFAEASAATSSRCPPTRASSSARWTSPTSTSSRA